MRPFKKRRMQNVYAIPETHRRDTVLMNAPYDVWKPLKQGDIKTPVSKY